MGTPHKHAALIKAWADGAEIQYKPGGKGGNWLDDEHPTWYSCIEYRIKPKTIKYRNFLWSPEFAWSPNKRVVCVCSEQEHLEQPRTDWTGFIKWLGDWQEVEV